MPQMGHAWMLGDPYGFACLCTSRRFPPDSARPAQFRLYLFEFHSRTLRGEEHSRSPCTIPVSFCTLLCRSAPFRHLSATFPPPFRHPSAILHPSAARVSVSHICPHLQHVLQNRIIGGHNVLFWALGAGLLQHLYVPVTRKQSCAPSLVSSHPVWLLAQPSSSWTLLRWTLLENSCNPSLAP